MSLSVLIPTCPDPCEATPYFVFLPYVSVLTKHVTFKETLQRVANI